MPRDGGSRLLSGRRYAYHPPMVGRFTSARMVFSLMEGLPGMEWPRLLPLYRSSSAFDTQRSVAQWVGIAGQRAAGVPGEEGQAWVAVRDCFDDGVVDSYELGMSGVPLTKDNSRNGVWRLRVAASPQ